jgi:hypothetical protein
MIRLDGIGADGVKKLTEKLEIAFRRLRRLVRPSRNTFMI